jgi:DNA (cytosine-5)-methyltransferase 1
MHIGIQQATAAVGMHAELRLACELNKDAQETYKRNHGVLPVGDIRSLDTLPDTDVLLAGFPCQAFSYGGAKKGFGDPRGTLFFEVMRLIDNSNRPSAMVFENVAGLVSHDEGRTLATIKHEVETRNYSFDWFYLNSSDYGLPQNRARIYMICIDLYKNQRPLKFNIKSDKGPPDSHSYNSQPDLWGNSNPVSVKAILEENPPKKYDVSPEFREALLNAVNKRGLSTNGLRLIDYRGGNSIHSWELGLRGSCTQEEIDFMNMFILERRKRKFGDQQDGKLLTLKQILSFWNRANVEDMLDNLCKMGYIKKVLSQEDSEMLTKYKPVSGNFSFDIFKLLDLDGISITLVSSDADRLGVYHNDRLRRITPREAARLQGFPEEFEPHPTDKKAYMQFGNAVSVNVARLAISEALRVAGFISPARREDQTVHEGNWLKYEVQGA